ncbi:PP2C family protein-serine/threonine phosphatase [Azospirillum lipoferum]|uniref:Serine/threonine phosphatase n=1 Tax=Azospirillum lipoferum (strain 4B) TaxID=862719 RepID=G7ZGE3_AZOL4|nr:protein phosphatase 2C domain-containing protein [Azospirillum lipoferum]CBS90930.1 putative serine/threonine phosphatase [Azospirillum lipoferum 4B]
MNLVIQHAGGQIQGARRRQEDSFQLVPMEDPHTGLHGVLAVLADGVGGAAAGDHASRRAVSVFASAFQQQTGSDDERLVIALAAANDALALDRTVDPLKEGMGCTLIAVAARSTMVTWISVGDSLLLRSRNGHLCRLNEDHSLAPELDRAAERGEISVEEALAHSDRHTITSALTGDPIPLVDGPHRGDPIQEDDRLILASDGLLSLSSHELSVLLEGGPQPAGRLVQQILNSVDALQLEGQDNTTVIVLAADRPDSMPILLEMPVVPPLRSLEAPAASNRRLKDRVTAIMRMTALFLSLVFLCSAGLVAAILLTGGLTYSAQSTPSAVIPPAGVQKSEAAKP